MSNRASGGREAGSLAEIADQLRAIAMTGLHYEREGYNHERYERVLRLAARLAAIASDAEPPEVEAFFRGTDSGYVTPKLDVRMAILDRDRILLVRERTDGLWAMPGGYVDVGDTPADAAVRETWEEAGVRVRASRLVGVFDRRTRPESPPELFHIHKLIFTGELLDRDPVPQAGHETLDARFHAVDALPELSLGRTLAFHVEEAFRVARDPTALPYFD
jgi:ADP-ribose pyrophosphatase YjhB (NUDIX family)